MSEVFIAFLNYLDQAEHPYPWQLLGTDFTEALAAAENQEMPLEMGELDEHSARFLASLDRWFPQDLCAGLQFKTLHERLQGWLPLELCRQIIEVCELRLGEGVELSDRLRCVLGDLLPQWSAADMDILLRSYGSALRGGTSAGLPDRAGQSWEELSPLAQAQYLAAIANFCLTELETELAAEME